MKRIAVFPGSFDPVTKGHVNLIERALPLFDEIIIGIGVNTSKSSLFSADIRKKWLEDVFKGSGSVRIEVYEGLTVDFCRRKGARYLLRGLRNGADFEYERTIAQMSRHMNPEIETVLLFTDPEYSAINSTVVREIIRYKGRVDRFLPPEVDVYA